MSFRNIQTVGKTEDEAILELHARIYYSGEHLRLRLESTIQTWEADGTWYAACRLCPVRQDQILDKTQEVVYTENTKEVVNG